MSKVIEFWQPSMSAPENTPFLTDLLGDDLYNRSESLYKNYCEAAPGLEKTTKSVSIKHGKYR
jgi:hypothetical protein